MRHPIRDFISDFIRDTLKVALGIFFPPKSSCPVCHNCIKDHTLQCPTCLAKLAWSC